VFESVVRSRLSRANEGPPVTCRFLAREFVYNDDALQKQQQEMEEASAEEKELWVSLHVLPPSVLDLQS
jgi:hypothetical protein